jgi:AP-2 complex subunit alpha
MLEGSLFFFFCYWRLLIYVNEQILIDRDFSLDYIYYKVPTPWLQVKCLRLLQYYPPPGKMLAIVGT